MLESKQDEPVSAPIEPYLVAMVQQIWERDPASTQQLRLDAPSLLSNKQAQLDQWLLKEDFTQVLLLAEEMAQLALQLGAAGLLHWAIQLQTSARIGQTEPARQTFARFSEECLRVQHFLTQAAS